MADSSQPPALPEGERQLAEALLTRALGEPAVVHAAEHVWDRDHVFRLHLASGRAVILKRMRGHGPASSQSFGDELAALDYLNAMPVPVAPRLLGADAQAGLLLMEVTGTRSAGPCTQIVPQCTSSGRDGRSASTSCRAAAAVKQIRSITTSGRSAATWVPKVPSASTASRSTVIVVTESHSGRCRRGHGCPGSSR